MVAAGEHGDDQKERGTEDASVMLTEGAFLIVCFIDCRALGVVVRDKVPEQLLHCVSAKLELSRNEAEKA